MKRFAQSLLGVALALATGLAAAQFPTKPIRIVVPYAPGSTLEPIVRAIGDDMSTALKQPVVVEYKPGASTTIGAGFVAQSPADGHTLFVNAASFLITAQLMSKLPYDPKTAFVPISGLAEVPHVLIAPAGAPYKTAAEFVTYARANAEKMSYGSFGNASSGHVGYERMKKLFNIKGAHIPYKGNEGVQDILAGRLDSMLNDLPVVVPFARDGKLRALAIAADKRDPNLPDVPTFQEATGTPFASKSWFGILVRAETPPQVRAALNTAVVNALRKPDIVKRLVDLGVTPNPTSPEAFADFMEQESKRLAEGIAFANVKME